jgi:hypothetical protein
MKMAVFWVVAPCSLVGVYQRFRGPCSLHHQGDDDHRPDDGGSKDLWNVGTLLQDYTVRQPRRQPSSGIFLFVTTNTLTLESTLSTAQLLLLVTTRTTAAPALKDA